jgi:hypothetical protein
MIGRGGQHFLGPKIKNLPRGVLREAVQKLESARLGLAFGVSAFSFLPFSLRASFPPGRFFSCHIVTQGPNYFTDHHQHFVLAGSLTQDIAVY